MGFLNLDFDRTAYELLQSGNCEGQSSIEAAARYGNWFAGNSLVRMCTAIDDHAARTSERLQSLISVGHDDTTMYTHALPKWLDNSAQWLALRGDNDALRELAERQHNAWGKRQKMCWITDESPAKATLSTLLKRLGLFHFGQLREGEPVIRFCYKLDNTCPGYKPDWRHGFDAFYFANASAFSEHGMTRSLEDASLACKEWVLDTKTINVTKHLHAVEVINIPEDVCLDLPSDAYWANLKNEICQAQRITVF
jgi:hypothetical protein